MDGENKIYLGEGVPLNSTGAANIFLKTGKSPKANTTDGTVIHLTEKPSDIGVHINTTFSKASSKKIKLLFVLNLLLSVICMVLSCSMAFYYWNEMISMRRQLELIKDHIFFQSLGQDKAIQSALVSHPRSSGDREPRMDNLDNKLPQNTKKFYVEDLGEDMLLVDSKKKNASEESNAKSTVLQRDLLVAQFNGAIQEFHMGSESIVGPWVRDKEVSSKNSGDFVELNGNYVTMKESGLYLVYAQIVYLSQAPNCYFVWARQTGETPRLLSACATADINTSRPLDRSQLSCSVQTVARLYKNDIVNIAQREPKRILWLRPGYSYFGLIKLSS